MLKILTLNAISPEGIRRFPEDRYQVGSGVEQPDAVLVRSHDMHSMEIPDSVLAVGRAGSGVNNIPVDALSKRGVPVFNAPGANANAVKELVLAGMLIAARNLDAASEYVRGLNLEGSELAKAVEAAKKQFVGFELPSRTIGVVGLGAVGVLVANAAHALGMQVLGFDPLLTVSRAWQLSSGVQQARSLDHLFTRADIVSLHVPLTDDTRGLVGEDLIHRLPDGAILLNFARGPIVDERGVIAALSSGKLARYVCDFPTRPLIDHERVLVLPHLGASTHEAEVNCAVQVANTLRNYIEHGLVRHSVNFPEADLPRMNAHRITVSNANVPSMVGRISMCLGDAGLNIEDLLNKSRGDLAYTILDLDGEPGADTLDELRAIEGVLGVRDLGKPAPT